MLTSDQGLFVAARIMTPCSGSIPSISVRRVVRTLSPVEASSLDRDVAMASISS